MVVVAPEDERGQGGEFQLGSNGRMFMVAFELCVVALPASYRIRRAGVLC
jgi:hypothetical protein